MKVVLNKFRKIYLVDPLKCHLGNEGNTKTFIEEEAIDNAGEIDMERLKEQCRQ